MPEEVGSPYKLVLLQQARERLRVWVERARRLGIAAEFAATLRRLEQRLTNEPLTWGDPQYRYRHLDLLLCRGYQDVLYALYAVDEGRRIVYLKDLVIQPGHPLGQDP